jgi:hypothetical protein
LLETGVFRDTLQVLPLILAKIVMEIKAKTAVEKIQLQIETKTIQL